MILWFSLIAFGAGRAGTAPGAGVGQDEVAHSQGHISPCSDAKAAHTKYGKAPLPLPLLCRCLTGRASNEVLTLTQVINITYSACSLRIMFVNAAQMLDRMGSDEVLTALKKELSSVSKKVCERAWTSVNECDMGFVQRASWLVPGMCD